MSHFLTWLFSSARRWQINLCNVFNLLVHKPLNYRMFVSLKLCVFLENSRLCLQFIQLCASFSIIDTVDSENINKIHSESILLTCTSWFERVKKYKEVTCVLIKRKCQERHAFWNGLVTKNKVNKYCFNVIVQCFNVNVIVYGNTGKTDWFP